MNIINQLEQTVTPAVLGASGSVAHISLLEQFYAILVTRLAVSEIYTQLQRNDQSYVEPSVARSILFEQLWVQPSQRHLLVQELATTHHVDEPTTEQLLINAAYLAYQELKNLANGQFLPAFLQLQQASVRQYLPVWAAAVVSPVVAVVAEETAVQRTVLAADALLYDNYQTPKAAVTTDQVLAADSVPVIVEGSDGQATMVSGIASIDSTDAIHANPSDYRTLDSHSNSSLAEIRQRNQRNDLIVRALLFAAALGAIALVWVLVSKNDDVEPIAPVATAPVEPAPEVEEPAPVLTPAQLAVSVDYSGNLYSCSATVGDIGLQDVLKQALYTSFGDQSNACQITVQEGVATTLTNVSIDALPNVLMLMRTAPFLRLQLQNDSMTLEAPDETLLQRLLVDMHTLLPAMTVTTATTITNTQPPANTYDETYNNNNYNNGAYNNGAVPNNGSAPITSDNNMMTNQQNQPPANNDNTDSVAPPYPSQNNPAPQSSSPMTPDTSDLEKPIFAEQPIIRKPAN